MEPERQQCRECILNFAIAERLHALNEITTTTTTDPLMEIGFNLPGRVEVNGNIGMVKRVRVTNLVWGCKNHITSLRLYTTVQHPSGSICNSTFPPLKLFLGRHFWLTPN